MHASQQCSQSCHDAALAVSHLWLLLLVSSLHGNALMQSATAQERKSTEVDARRADWVCQLCLWRWQIWRTSMVSGHTPKAVSGLQILTDTNASRCCYGPWTPYVHLVCQSSCSLIPAAVLLLRPCTYAGGTRLWMKKMSCQRSTEPHGVKARRLPFPQQQLPGSDLLKTMMK